MAITPIGSLGSVVLPKSSGTTQALAITANAEAGNLVVVAAAWDNAGTAEAETSQLSLADDSTNSWTKIREYTMSSGAANDGVTLGVWAVKVATQINSGANITCTSASARTAKAMGAYEFTFGSGALSFDGVQGTDYQVDGAAAADPAAVTLSGLSLREYLLIHAVGSEAGTTSTADADYTEIFDIETTGGQAATNISLFVGYRVATLTGDTADAASTTDRDYAQILAAVYEAGTGPPPATSVVWLQD